MVLLSRALFFLLFFGTLSFTTIGQRALSEYQEQNFRYNEGYYFDSTGTQTKGYIRHILHNHNVSRHADNFIFYKKHHDSLDLRLSTRDIDGFVVNEDSFVVVKKFKFHGWQSYREDFCKVVIPEGKVRLLEHYTLTTFFDDHGAHYKVDTGYVMLVQGLAKPHCVHMDYFKRDLTTLFRVNEDLCNKINADAYKPEDIELIVSEFNRWWKNKL